MVDRLARLRRECEQAGETCEELQAVVHGIDKSCLQYICAMFFRCQLWYAESASSALSPEAQLKVLAIAMCAAMKLLRAAQSGRFHVSLLPLVRAFHDPNDRSCPYRLRLIETLLASVSFAQIVDDKLGILTKDNPLVTV